VENQLRELMLTGQINCVIPKVKLFLEPSRSHFCHVRYGLGVPDFDFRQQEENLLFTKTSLPVPGPTQPSFQWVPAFFHRTVNRPGPKVNHSLPVTVE